MADPQLSSVEVHSAPQRAGAARTSCAGAWRTCRAGTSPGAKQHAHHPRQRHASGPCAHQ
eukprot:7486455-Alexandrium_andersonii.AAC.1